MAISFMSVEVSANLGETGAYNEPCSLTWLCAVPADRRFYRRRPIAMASINGCVVDLSSAESARNQQQIARAQVLSVGGSNSKSIVLLNKSEAVGFASRNAPDILQQQISSDLPLRIAA